MRINRHIDRSAPLTRRLDSSYRSRKQGGGSWGTNKVKLDHLRNRDFRKGGIREPDYGSLRVLLDSPAAEADPRMAWATIEEDLPADLESEHHAAQQRDLRHFTACRDCSRGLPCEEGKRLAGLRALWLDLIALRNRGFGLAQSPRSRVPGSAYGNTR